jgi:exopolysaccharide production protein ExoZ
MVVAAHVTSFAGITPGLWSHQRIGVDFHGMVLGVDLFFVLSGIVILSAHWQDIGRPARLGSYLWKRVRRIYPIYWIFLTLTFAKHIATWNNGYEDQRNPFVILSSYLLVHIHSTDVLMTVSWTLFHEVLFYVVFAAFILDRRLGFLILVPWMAASFFFFDATYSPYWGTIFSPVHLLFIFGMVAALMLRRDSIPWPLPMLVAGCVSFTTAVALVPVHNYASSNIELLAGFGAMLMLLGAAELERSSHFTVPRWLSFLGDASYSLYLSNFMVVATSAKIFYRLDQHLHLPIAVWMLLMAVLAVLTGCISYVWIEKPILRLLGRSGKPTMRVAVPAS